jgi:hypothetical protein
MGRGIVEGLGRSLAVRSRRVKRTWQPRSVTAYSQALLTVARICEAGRHRHRSVSQSRVRVHGILDSRWDDCPRRVRPHGRGRTRPEYGPCSVEMMARRVGVGGWVPFGCTRSPAQPRHRDRAGPAGPPARRSGAGHARVQDAERSHAVVPPRGHGGTVLIGGVAEPIITLEAVRVEVDVRIAGEP